MSQETFLRASGLTLEKAYIVLTLRIVVITMPWCCWLCCLPSAVCVMGGLSRPRIPAAADTDDAVHLFARLGPHGK